MAMLKAAFVKGFTVLVSVFQEISLSHIKTQILVLVNLHYHTHALLLNEFMFQYFDMSNLTFNHILREFPFSA